jgi:hypothetical protein
LGTYWSDLPVRTLDEYLVTEIGGLGLSRPVELGPSGTIEEVSRSGLRGRGPALLLRNGGEGRALVVDARGRVLLPRRLREQAVAFRVDPRRGAR